MSAPELLGELGPSGALSCDQLGVVPLRLLDGEGLEELAPKVERLLDRPALPALAHEPMLGPLGEGEVAAVVFGDRCLRGAVHRMRPGLTVTKAAQVSRCVQFSLRADRVLRATGMACPGQ
jgi:hypothetical protein